MKISALHNDTPLGSWTYGEWRPQHLAGLVEVVWYFKGPTSSARKRERRFGVFLKKALAIA